MNIMGMTPEDCDLYLEGIRSVILKRAVALAEATMDNHRAGTMESGQKAVDADIRYRTAMEQYAEVAAALRDYRRGI